MTKGGVGDGVGDGAPSGSQPTGVGRSLKDVLMSDWVFDDVGYRRLMKEHEAIMYLPPSPENDERQNRWQRDWDDFCGVHTAQGYSAFGTVVAGAEEEGPP